MSYYADSILDNHYELDEADFDEHQYYDDDDWQQEEYSEPYYSEISYRDLMDVPRRPSFRGTRKVAKAVSHGLALLSLPAITIVLSQMVDTPKLSPEDIVKMRTLSASVAANTLFVPNHPSTKTIPSKPKTAATTASSAGTSSGCSHASNGQCLEQNAGLDFPVHHSNLREIPAVAYQTPSTAAALGDNALQDVARMKAVEMWSNVRSDPTTQGDILTSLPTDATVTVLSQHDNWYEVQVEDENIVGFMHTSVLGLL